jgi:hypothetical protein
VPTGADGRVRPSAIEPPEPISLCEIAAHRCDAPGRRGPGDNRDHHAASHHERRGPELARGISISSRLVHHRGRAGDCVLSGRLRFRSDGAHAERAGRSGRAIGIDHIEYSLDNGDDRVEMLRSLEESAQANRVDRVGARRDHAAARTAERSGRLEDGALDLRPQIVPGGARGHRPYPAAGRARRPRRASEYGRALLPRRVVGLFAQRAARASVRMRACHGRASRPPCSRSPLGWARCSS